MQVDYTSIIIERIKEKKEISEVELDNILTTAKNMHEYGLLTDIDYAYILIKFYERKINIIDKKYGVET